MVKPVDNVINLAVRRFPPERDVGIVPPDDTTDPRISALCTPTRACLLVGRGPREKGHP
jgi:hypothetical protein